MAWFWFMEWLILVYVINRIIQASTLGDMEFIFSCSHSISNSFAALTRSITMWTLEDKFHISACPYIILYIIRKDRSRSGGGVAFHFWENLSYTNRIDLVPYTLEMICAEINLPHSRSFLVSTRCRPPSVKMQLFDEYEKFVQRCDIEHKKLILMGNIKSDCAKICTPWCTYSNSAVHILCLSVRATKSPPKLPWIFGHYYWFNFYKCGRQHSNLWCYPPRDFGSQSNLCVTKVCCTQN